MATLLLCACHKDEINFTWSPTEPRAGQSVLFASATTDGDEWVWDFGDGTSSTLKSSTTTKIYKEAGRYTVKMRIDGSSLKTRVHEVTIYDTIPTFTVSNDSLSTWREVTLTALTYNPYSLALSYEWELPEGTVITEGEVTDKTVKVYFTQAAPDSSATVSLRTTIGDQTTTKSKRLTIHHRPAPSLLFSTADGRLLRQRIYDLGTAPEEDITPSGFPQSANLQLLADSNTVYIMTRGTGTDAAAYAYDQSTHTLEPIATGESTLTAEHFRDAMLYNGYLYWTAADGIYRTACETRNMRLEEADIFADKTSLQGVEAGEGFFGICHCSGLYFASTAAGIVRFTEGDIQSGTAPATGIILPAEGKQAMPIQADRIEGKIYLQRADGEGLAVTNRDGGYTKTLAKGAGAVFAVCNPLNALFYATSEGLLRLPLVHTQDNNLTATADTTNHRGNITAVTVDQTER